MSLQSKIFRNTLVQVLGKVASTALNLFAFALMTRELGQAGFGEYTTVVTFLSFFAIIADLGLTLVTVQMINSEEEHEEKILGNLFGLRLISALFFIGLAPAVVLLFDYSAGIKFGVLLAAASYFFTALNQIMVGLFQNRLKMDRVAWAETLSRFVLIIGVVLSIAYNWGLNGILIATSAASLASFALHFYFSRQFARIRPLFQLSWWRKIINLSWPLAITIAFNLIYLRADTLILSLVKGQADVGLYGAAYKIIDVLSSLPFMFAGIVLPLLVTAWQHHDKERFNRIFQKSFDAMAMAALPLAVGTQFVSDELIALIAGSEFREAGPILCVLILAVAAIFLGNMAAHAIIAIKAQKNVIWIYVFTGITSLIAYLLLIPRFSYFGAAAVTVYSEFTIAFLSTAFLFRRTHLKLDWSGLGKAVVASVLMGIMLYFWPAVLIATPYGLLATIALAGIVYLFVLYALRAFTKSDLNLILKNK